ncbi:hypothetical protein [Hallella colorans]|uniref:hypothetical protein n=1 Tax=Hallella colorans TaxID=1703337 RepID=UPI0023F3AA1E|nr:hypothetical protein [Hallella colorans]
MVAKTISMEITGSCGGFSDINTTTTAMKDGQEKHILSIEGDGRKRLAAWLYRQLSVWPCA